MSEHLKFEECVTMTQFNEMKPNMEKKQEKLSQDLKEIISQLRIHHNVYNNASNQDDEVEETN
jgi:hypothetical protein